MAQIFVPPLLALTCWLIAALGFKALTPRRWPLLLFPMATLMIASILSFADAKLALDAVRSGTPDTQEAAELLARVLLGEVSVYGWSAAAFAGVAWIEAFKIPAVGPAQPKWAAAMAAVAALSVPVIALTQGSAAMAWALPLVGLVAIGPVLLAVHRPDADPGRRSERMVTLGISAAMTTMTGFLAIRRLNEGLGYSALALEPDLAALPNLTGWGLYSGFAVGAVVGVLALLSLWPTRIGDAPERFASALFIALGVGTAAFMFNVPTHFAKDRVRAWSRPGQFVVLETRLQALPVQELPQDSGQGSQAILMLEDGGWFDSRTGIPVQLPVQDLARYTDDQGRLVLAMRPDAPAQELLASPFGVDSLAVVVRGPEPRDHDALAHLSYGVVPVSKAAQGQAVPPEMALSELLEACPRGCELARGM